MTASSKPRDSRGLVWTAGKNVNVSFPMYKDGDVVRAMLRSDGFFKKQKLYDPMPIERIFAVDTESTFKKGELHTDLIPIAWYNEALLLDEEDDHPDTPLTRLLAEVVTRYGMPMTRPSNTRQRPKLSEELRLNRKLDSTTGRDGLRLKIPPHLSVWFNLPYDISRLFPDPRLLKRIYAGANSYRMKVTERYEIEWLRYIDTSAPQFHWLIRDYHEKQIVRLIGLDLTGYWKCSLEDALSAVGLKGKVDIEAVVQDVHERAFETFSPTELANRRSYAVVDAEQTLKLYHETVSILMQVDPGVIRKTGMIPPSAPGAAARIMFGKAFAIHPKIESWKRPEYFADYLGSLAYYGGRAFAAKPGVHANMISLDLKSAYPAVMSMLPDPVTCIYERVEKGPFDLERFKGQFGVLRIQGEALDPLYPPFRIHADSRLRYISGKFTTLAVTIPEIVIGVLRGALRVHRIIDGVVLRGTSETSFLRQFILAMYALKEEHGKGPLGLFAKLLMNSAYGKLVEVNAHEFQWEGLVPIPSWPTSNTRIAETLVALLSSDAEEAPEKAFVGSGDAETLEARRRMLTNRIRESCKRISDVELAKVTAYTSVIDEVFGPPPRQEPLKRFLRHARGYRCGYYFMPVFGAQITGFVSAQLGLMGACLRAFIGDTDSCHLVAPPNGSPLETEGGRRYFEIMGEAGYVAPELAKKESLIAGTTLGTWMPESPAPSTESVVCRPKRYSHKFVLPAGTPPKAYAGMPSRVLETGEIECYKQAIHGFSKYTTPDAELAMKDTSIPKKARAEKAAFLRAQAMHEEMKKMVAGAEMRFETKRSPRKGRTVARAGGIAGEFVSRTVVARNEPVLHTRMREDGWVEWSELG